MKIDLVLTIGEQLQQHSKQWVLGSSYFSHMCPYKYWFETYEKKSSGTSGNVLMGNDAPCTSVGIDSIQIKMHDGVVRNLTEVCNIPKLKKNLVYVDAMDSKGFSYWVEGGVIQIIGKGKVMVMQGTKQGNLYIFRGPL